MIEIPVTVPSTSTTQVSNEIEPQMSTQRIEVEISKTTLQREYKEHEFEVPIGQISTVDIQVKDSSSTTEVARKEEMVEEVRETIEVEVENITEEVPEEVQSEAPAEEIIENAIKLKLHRVQFQIFGE